MTPERLPADPGAGTDQERFAALAARPDLDDEVRHQLVDRACAGPPRPPGAAAADPQGWFLAALGIPGLGVGHLLRLAQALPTVHGACAPAVLEALLGHPAAVDTVPAMLMFSARLHEGGCVVRDCAAESAAVLALDPGVLAWRLGRRDHLWDGTPPARSVLAGELAALGPSGRAVALSLAPQWAGTGAQLLASAGAVAAGAD